MFLLCSDGLSGPVKDEEIGAILHCLEPQDATETLVNLANLRGGPDNISAIVAKVEGEMPQSAALDATGEVPAGNRRTAAPLWVMAGACLAVLAYCLVNGYWLGIVGSAIALVAAVASGLAFRSTTVVPCSPVGSIGGPYGNGPYRKIQCSPNGKVTASLADLTSKLRDLPNSGNNNGNIDWRAFDTARSEAQAAAENGDHVAAVRQYAPQFATS